MAVLLNVDAEDVGACAMAAMAWVMGLPLDRSDEAKVRFLASQVEAVLGELDDENTGQPVRLVKDWWKVDA